MLWWNASETNWVVTREENLYLKFWDADSAQIAKTTYRLSPSPLICSSQIFYNLNELFYKPLLFPNSDFSRLHVVII